MISLVTAIDIQPQGMHRFQGVFHLYKKVKQVSKQKGAMLDGTKTPTHLLGRYTPRIIITVYMGAYPPKVWHVLYM